MICRSHFQLYSQTRFRFLSISSAFVHNFNPIPSFSTKSRFRQPTTLIVRNCSSIPNSGSITAKPSSELRNKRKNSELDDKLRRLRELFSRPNINIDAYIIPSQDAHQSEFIADCYARREYISGFTGSAGTAVITKDKAALWTDGRYFLQAEEQLNSSWILMRAGNLGVPTSSEWLNGVLTPGSRIGIDPLLNVQKMFYLNVISQLFLCFAAGSGANGAIIHYRPDPNRCSTVDTEKLFLLDSGAQYIDGTTDITRTVHFGKPSSRQKECFTRVLQGHIALDQAIFPENTPGFVLDAFARSALWKIGLDYRHGTGHGVGAALNVHEGPQSISFRFGNMTPLLKGMVVSNEPGYYEDHSFGIRIENLLFVKEVDTPNRFGGIGYMGFEKLTFVPIQTKMVDLSLLSTAEVDWLNDYHRQTWEKVSPLVSGSARQWLWNNTRPVGKPLYGLGA
ncbi:probable Xaa-Pro aminopeptidase P [Olea europaea var. sylvestris]|uniref:probable Xaa-Pro aminopeptidase P n=1 Tax=Olea europaea var. sylvestris TaxID=158386 RepID=UPI000C1D3B5B|nr:probable Xaa-Pro aminopeptidase P [Olea europaea var. sylvestris]